MPYLGDYIGQLISEIAMARMQADLETVRLAELYASHPLLRTMPIPHLRLPEVNLDVPVLIKASEEPRKGETARGGLNFLGVRQKLEEVAVAHLAKAGIDPATVDRQKLQVALDEQIRQPPGPAETSIDVHRVAAQITTAVVNTVRAGAPKPESLQGYETNLKEAVRLELLKARNPPPRLDTLVTSPELRESGTSENLTRLKIRVSEQAFEWTTIDSNGSQREMLVPE